jgi:hypothetical protein
MNKMMLLFSCKRLFPKTISRLLHRFGSHSKQMFHNLLVRQSHFDMSKQILGGWRCRCTVSGKISEKNRSEYGENLRHTLDRALLVVYIPRNFLTTSFFVSKKNRILWKKVYLVQCFMTK